MQDLALKMLQDVPNVIGGRVHSDCARNLASCRQAFIYGFNMSVKHDIHLQSGISPI